MTRDNIIYILLIGMLLFVFCCSVFNVQISQRVYNAIIALVLIIFILLNGFKT